MAYRSVASAEDTSSSNANVAGSLPAGTAAGDRLLAFINVDLSTATWASSPSGWTRIGDQSFASGNPDGGVFEVWEKLVATGSDAVTWVLNAAGAWRITIVALTGRHATAAATFATKTTNQTANASPVSISGSSGTAATGDDVVVGALLDITSSQTWSFASWSGSLTERSDPATTSWTHIGVATQDNVTAGAFGTVSVTASGTGNAGWVLYAVSVPVAATGQFSRPNADVSDGSWTPSTGSDNYAVLDETTASDADYSSVNSNSTLRVGLSSISTPDSGTRTLRYRASGSPEKKLLVRLIENTTTVQTFTTDPITATVTQYNQTVTGSITNYGDLDVEFEIADATSPPTLQVTWGAVGTAASGTTSCAPSYPTGISALTSKLYCMVTGRSNTANTAPTMPAGWTSIGALEGGTGTWGVDTGTRRVQLFVKDTVTGSETGTVTVSLGGTTANTLRASIFRVEVPSGYGIDVSVGTGADTSHDTSYSATSSTSLAFAPNDLLVVGTAQNIDTATGTSAFSATSITFGTVTRQANTAVTNGNDHRHIVATASVTAGTATSAPVHTYTGSVACSGPSLFARMRAVVPTEKGRVTWAEFETPAGGGAQTLTQSSRFDSTGTFYGPTVSPGAVTLSPGRFDNTGTFYTHVVSQPAGLQTLTQDTRYDSTGTFYAPTVTTSITLPQASRYDSTQTFYSPTVTTAITLPQSARFDNAQTFYGPTVTTTVTLTQGTRYDNTSTFYAATISQVGGAQTLTQNSRFDSAQTFYAATVTPGAVTLTPTRYDNGQTFYSATISQDGAAQTLTQSARFDNAYTFFSPTVTPGGVTLTPTRVDNTPTFFAPTVTTDITLAAERFDNTNTFFSPTVSPGAVTILPALFQNAQTWYVHEIDQGGTYTITAAQARLLWRIYLLHGLGDGTPLVNTTDQRVAGDLVQSITTLGDEVTISTTAVPVGLGVTPGTVIDELAALHGLTADLVVAPGTRQAGTVAQTIVETAGPTVTVARAT